jgi:hypothetical protein
MKYKIDPEIQKCLNLAGKLAVASDGVINSNAKGFSFNIMLLEVALDNYNEQIISLVGEKEEQQ